MTTFGTLDLLDNAHFIFNACIVIVRIEELAVSCIIANLISRLLGGDDLVEPFYPAYYLAKERRTDCNILTSP
jgi:hypothetical protein